jgi:hypothetical protein
MVTQILAVAVVAELTQMVGIYTAVPEVLES